MEGEEYSSERHSGNRGHGHRQASTAELMESAKVVAGAAQSAFARRSAEGIDKARVSEAAEELLGAAKKYGKLEGGSGLGGYLDKAEGYLHNLHPSEGAAPHGRPEHRPDRYKEEEGEDRPSRQEHRPARYEEEEEESRPSRQEHRPARYNDEEEESRPSRQEHRPARYNDDEEEESRPSGGGGGGGGIGDYLKMAQGFLK